MARKEKAVGRRGGLGGAVLVVVLVLIALAATNPDRQQFRDVMRAQGKFITSAASYLPMKRTNYLIASRFDIQYGIGTTTCWGAAYTVFICPERPEKRRPTPAPSDEANPTGAEG